MQQVKARSVITTFGLIGIIAIDILFIHGRLAGVSIFLVALLGFLMLAGSRRSR